MIFDYQNSEALATLQSVLSIVAAIVLGAVLLAVAVEVTRYFISSDEERSARAKLFADLKRIALFGVGVVLLATPTLGLSIYEAFSDTAIEEQIEASAAHGTSVASALTPQGDQWENAIIEQAATSAKESAGGVSGINGTTEAGIRSALKGALTSAVNVGGDAINACEAILNSSAYARYGTSLTNEQIQADSTLVATLNAYGITDLSDTGLVSSTWLTAGSAIESLNDSLGIEDFTDPDKSYLDDAFMHTGATTW